MVEGGRGPSFPVVFFDGEREMNIGDIKINPTLEYKPFQHMLSHKIGISPNQISIYLVDQKRSPKAPFSEDRRRIPITGKVNFGLICGQRDCCFLVVLKRSRKSRNRRERVFHGAEFGDFLSDGGFPPSPPPPPLNMVLLRRNQQDPFYDEIAQSELADLNDRLQSLRIQRDNYQMAMGKGNLDSIPNPSAGIQTSKALCGECEDEARNGSSTSFHLCFNDAVIPTRFISPAGPISRPYRPV